MKRSRAILPIGKVNLKTGANALFGVVWDGWEEDPTVHNMLVQFDNKQIIVHTCGEGDEVGTNAEFHHDQTQRRYGQGTVLAVQPHTKDGLLELSKIVGKTIVTMATYK